MARYKLISAKIMIDGKTYHQSDNCIFNSDIDVKIIAELSAAEKAGFIEKIIDVEIKPKAKKT
jgi:hypothetical protein